MSTDKKNNNTYTNNDVHDFNMAVMAIAGMGINIIEKDDRRWFKIGYCIAEAFGDDGRADFHAISAQCIPYYKAATNEKYDRCLLSLGKYRINMGFFYFMANQAFYRETGMSLRGFLRYVHSNK